jgi:hypothetical protein
MVARSRAIVIWLASYVSRPHGERGSILSVRESAARSTGWPATARHRERQMRSRGRVATAALSTALLAGSGLGIGGTDSAAGSGGAAGPTVARISRTVSLGETGHLRLTSKKGFTLNERGSASGTIAGTIYIHLHLVSDTKVTAEVNIYPREGSLTGSGSAAYRVVGGYASFSGTLSITRGSGKYAHARASGLRFTGTIQRRDDSVTVRLSGPLSY